MIDSFDGPEKYGGIDDGKDGVIEYKFKQVRSGHEAVNEASRTPIFFVEFQGRELSRCVHNQQVHDRGIRTYRWDACVTRHELMSVEMDGCRSLGRWLCDLVPRAYVRYPLSTRYV